MSQSNSDPNYWQPSPRPRSRTRFAGCFLRTLGVLVIAVGIYFVLTNKPSGRAIDLEPAISSFTGEPDLMIKQTGAQQTSYGNVKQYSANLANGDQVYFGIGEEGNVTSFFRAQQPNDEVRIGIERARKTAMDFVADRYADLSWLETVQPIENLIGTDGSSNRFYSFRWIRQDPKSGAILPQMLTIQVNAQTGQVDKCSMLDEPVTVSTIPAIDKATAIQAALSAIPEAPAFEITQVILTITTVPIYEPAGEQALVWSVTVEAKPDPAGYVAGAVVFIDAQTGEVLLVDPFA